MGKKKTSRIDSLKGTSSWMIFFRTNRWPISVQIKDTYTFGDLFKAIKKIPDYENYSPNEIDSLRLVSVWPGSKKKESRKKEKARKVR